MKWNPSGRWDGSCGYWPGKDRTSARSCGGKQKISPLALPWTISLQKVDKQTHQFYRGAELLMIG